MSKAPTQMADRRHELLEDMVKQITLALTEFEVDKDVAEQCGCAVADHFATHWGGQIITIPKDHFHRLAERDLEVFHRFTGANHAALAREFDMSVRGIYRVLARVQRRDIDTRQGRLDLLAHTDTPQRDGPETPE